MRRYNFISIVALTGVGIGCLPDLPEWANDTSSFGNERPQINAVSLSPENPTVEDTVEVLIDAIDPDGDAIDFDYTWRVNGEVRGDSTATLVGAAYFQKGDTISVEVMPYDAIGPGMADSAGPIEVRNAAPTDPIVTLTPLERCATLTINESTSMDMPHYENLELGDTFTVEMWIFINELPPAQANPSALILAQGSGKDLGFRLGLEATQDGSAAIELTLPDGTLSSTQAESPIAVSDWNHVVLTHDYPYWSIYINGQKKLAHWTEAAEMPGIAMPIRLGNYGSYQSFDGGFYSIRISDSNLFSDAGESFDYTQARYSMIRPNARTLGLWLMGPEPEEVTFREDGDGVRYQVLLDHSAHAHDIRVQDGTWDENCPGLSIKDIRCEARDSVDHDGDFFSYSFEWRVDGMDIFAHPVNDKAQDIWAEQIPNFSEISCTVRATDAADTSEPVTESFIQ